MATQIRAMGLFLVVCGMFYSCPPALGNVVPNHLRIAVVVAVGVENAWDKSFIDSVQNVARQKPHGLNVVVRYIDKVDFSKAELVIRTFAETGEYDIIMGDSSYADAVEEVMADYPKLMFVIAGAGNRPLGKNGYWITVHAHEAAYLLGMLAGGLTKSNIVGVVAAFPADNANDEINAFFLGARDLDPIVRRKLTFIRTWYDPAKTTQATIAEAAAGTDFIFQLTPVFEGCVAKAIGCFGNFVDLNRMAPATIVSSVILDWSPSIQWLVDEWWRSQLDGTPLNAPLQAVWFSMAKGALDIAPYHGWENRIPEKLKRAVTDARFAIIRGDKVIPLNTAQPGSD